MQHEGQFHTWNWVINTSFIKISLAIKKMTNYISFVPVSTECAHYGEIFDKKVWYFGIIGFLKLKVFGSRVDENRFKHCLFFYFAILHMFMEVLMITCYNACMNVPPITAPHVKLNQMEKLPAQKNRYCLVLGWRINRGIQGILSISFGIVSWQVNKQLTHK